MDMDMSATNSFLYRATAASESASVTANTRNRIKRGAKESTAAWAQTSKSWLTTKINFKNGQFCFFSSPALSTKGSDESSWICHNLSKCLGIIKRMFGNHWRKSLILIECYQTFRVRPFYVWLVNALDCLLHPKNFHFSKPVGNQLFGWKFPGSTHYWQISSDIVPEWERKSQCN